MAYHRKRMSLAPALFTGVAGALAYRAIRPLRPPETLDGKTVLVTGGSRGLGFAIAQEAAARGARIAICGRDPSSLERARAVLADMGAPVAALPCDVTDLAAVQLLVDTVGRALASRARPRGWSAPRPRSWPPWPRHSRPPSFLPPVPPG